MPFNIKREIHSQNRSYKTLAVPLIVQLDDQMAVHKFAKTFAMLKKRKKSPVKNLAI